MCFFKEKQLIVFISTVNFRNISTYGTPKKYKVINHLVNLLKGKYTVHPRLKHPVQKARQ